LLKSETTEPCRNVHVRLPDAINAATITLSQTAAAREY